MSYQRLLTREAFQHYVAKAQIKLFVRPPYAVVPCTCGDINCHGWRFVEVRRELAPTRHDAHITESV